MGHSRNSGKQAPSKSLQSIAAEPIRYKTAFTYLFISKAACCLTSPSSGKEGEEKNIDLQEGYVANLLSYGLIPYSLWKETSH